MNNPRDILRSLLHRLGVAGPARSRVCSGTGASKISRGSGAPARLVLPVLATTLGALAFTAAPALAAISPTVTIKPVGTVTSTTALLSGTVNPNGSLTTTSWVFQYSMDPETEGWTPSAAGGVAIAAEEVTGTIEGLQPNAAYQVRLVATNEEGGEGVSAEPNPTVTTLAALPKVDSESASAVKSTVATLEAQVNPNNAKTSAYMQYSTSATVIASGPEKGALQTPTKTATPPGAEVGSNFEDHPVEPGALTALSADITLFYQAVATNATGTTYGAVQELTTVPVPHTGTVEALTATTAKLNGQLTLNPLNTTVTTLFSFDYNPSATECVNGTTIATGGAGPGSGPVSSAQVVNNLQPNATYSVCFITSNAYGSEAAAPPVQFKTLAAPASIDSMSVSNIKSSEATLEGKVNPNNQLTECHFQYVDEAEFLGSGFTAAGTVTLPCSPEQLKGFGEQTVSPTRTEVKEGNSVTVPAPITGLAQGTEYHYRILTKNGKGEEGIEAKTFRTTDEPEKRAATEVMATTATLNGVLNPHNEFEAGTYEFVYRQSESECNISPEEEAKGATQSKAPVPPGSSKTKSPQPVSADITGLQPGATYTFCLLQRNGAGEQAAISSPETFTMQIAALKILSESVSAVESAGATLEAQINPDGAATTYHFEYDTTPYTSSAKHGTSITEEGENTELEIGAGTSPVPVEVKVKGLSSGATYYYRVLAENEVGGKTETEDGAGKTFTTAAPQSTNSKECKNEQRRAEQSAGLALPDCRAYELVSPENTGGQGAVYTESESQPRAAVAGDAVAYESESDFGESPRGAGLYSQYVSRRGAEGWRTENVSPPQFPKASAGLGGPDNADAFTPELTEGILTSSASLTGEAPVGEEFKAFLYRQRFGSGSYQYIGQLGPGATRGREEGPRGESTNLEDVVYNAQDESGVEWLDGRNVPVTVLNSREAITTLAGIFGNGQSQTWHAVSEDGTQVIFTSPPYENNAGKYAGGQALYQRINTGEPQSKMSGEQCIEPTAACTIDVSASQRTIEPDLNGPKPVDFWTASTDGSRIFFTSDEELTNDAYTGPADNAANLYEYEAAKPGQPGHLTDLTVDDSEDGAAVQGVVQSSEDGGYIYFVADGVLPTKAVAGQPNPVAGQPNLYLSQNGEARFIATLGEGDSQDWAGPASTAADVSPSGSTLAFLSGQPLAGYDTQPATPAECTASGTGKCQEVYLYDAGTGAPPVCASCNPSGARPVGEANLSRLTGVGGPPNGQGTELLYRTRNIAGARLFFNSSDALAGAAGGVENVFEFEDGHVYPISDVAGGQPSKFLDAGATGEDVFFASPNRLLPQAQAELEAVYDARVGGGFPVAPPECTTAEACRNASPPTPAAYGPGPSETFSGPGNFAPAPPVVVPKKVTKKTVKCKKGDVKSKKGKCVRKPKKAKKTNRRAK
jgi:hypothetical protein